MKISHLLLSFLTLTFAVTPNHAAVVTWTVGEFDDATQLALTGTLVEAFNLGSNTALTVNTILFATGGSISNPTTGSINYIDATLYDSVAEPIAGLSEADANTFLDSLVYLPGVGNNRWRLPGLVIGQQYSLQFLTTDDRFPPVTPPTATADYAAFTGGPASIAGAVISGRLDGPKIFTGTFTATESTQDFFVGMTNGGGNNLQIAAYQLRAIPEPGSALLVAAAGLGLAARRRRR